MIKLTKKQSEIIEMVKGIKNEVKEEVYFMFNQFTKKIHAVTIKLTDTNEVEFVVDKAMLCTHKLAMNMEEKGILVPETIGKYKMYKNEDRLYDFVLMKVNPILQ